MACQKMTLIKIIFILRLVALRLSVIHLGVFAVFPYQIVVTAGFNYSSVLDIVYDINILRGGKSVGDKYHGLVRAEPEQLLVYVKLTQWIKRRGGFIKNIRMRVFQ